MIGQQAIEIIKKARKAKGWTQEYMASKIAERLEQSYSIRQYQKLEVGEFPKYKEKIIIALEEILDIEIFNLVYENKVQESDSPAYYSKDFQNDPIQATSQFEEVIYVSAAKQTEYPTRFQEPSFIEDLPRASLPGFTHQGKQHRIFEVNSNFVTPYFRQGDFLICKRTEFHSLEEIDEYTLYVVVSEADIIIGWLAIKNDKYLVLKIQTENFSGQMLLPVKDIKELWHVEYIIQTVEPVIKRFNINTQ